MTTRHIQCRYLRRSGEQCSAEVLDPDAEVLICAKHAGRVLELTKRRMTTAKKTVQAQRQATRRTS